MNFPSRNEQQVAGFLDSTSHCNSPVTDSRSKYFIAGSARIIFKNPVDSAVHDRAFNIVKGQIVIRHLLEEVWNHKLILLVPHFFTDEPDDFCVLGHLN